MSQFNKFTSAVYNGKDVIAKKELEHIDLQKTDDYGYTALMICAFAHNNNILKHICDNNIVCGIINKTSVDGTALDIAIDNNYEDTAIILVKNGIKINDEQAKKMRELGWEKIFNLDIGNFQLDIDDSYYQYADREN